MNAPNNTPQAKSFRKLVLQNTEIPKKLRHFLPSGFQRIGNIVVLRLSTSLEKYSVVISKTILDNFPYVRTVCLQTDSIRGEFRKPSIKVIAGEKNTLALHKENGCIFKIDVSKVMFSKGNLNERGRIPPLVRDGETIIDMFAGIGYFTIPIARFSCLNKIYAIEKNPEAFKLLVENIKINKVGKFVVPVQGDCRKIKINERADRIIMGYLPETYRYLITAFSFLKSRGIIHYHDTFHMDELWEKPKEVLDEYARANSFKLHRILYRKKVKSYAPNIYHAVIDAEFEKE